MIYSRVICVSINSYKIYNTYCASKLKLPRMGGAICFRSARGPAHSDDVTDEFGYAVVTCNLGNVEATQKVKSRV